MSDKALPGAGGVLRLRNLAMLESIRRVADPAWRDRLERQQTLARLERLFGHRDQPLEAVQDHASALREELQSAPWPPAGQRGEDR
jgi:septal ring factor EnvC (AmiA/AmiB activator)